MRAIGELRYPKSASASALLAAVMEIFHARVKKCAMPFCGAKEIMLMKCGEVRKFVRLYLDSELDQTGLRSNSISNPGGMCRLFQAEKKSTSGSVDFAHGQCTRPLEKISKHDAPRPLRR